MFEVMLLRSSALQRAIQRVYSHYATIPYVSLTCYLNMRAEKNSMSEAWPLHVCTRVVYNYTTAPRSFREGSAGSYIF